MKIKVESYQNMGFFISLVLLLLSPFHALLITFIRTLPLPGNVQFLIGVWREILLVILAILTIPRFIKVVRNHDLRLRFWHSIKWFLPFLGLAVIFLFIQKNTIQWLWGARFDLLLFVTVIIFSLVNFSDRQKEILKKGILWVGLTVFVFGILHSLVLPRDFLLNIGYSVNRDIWDVSTAISSCQPLEHTSEFCRAISTFGGPTRYGTYILLVMSLAGYGLLKKNKQSEQQNNPTSRFNAYFLSAIFFLGLVNLFLTYSRGIWVGFFVMVVAGIILASQSGFKKDRPSTNGLENEDKRNLSKFGEEKKSHWLKTALVLFSALLIFLFFTFDSWATIFLREGSTFEHLYLLKQGWEIFTREFLGRGLGTAGPASLHFHKLITENWYLQIGIETGLLGLLFWLLGLFRLFAVTVKNAPPLFLVLVGISVAGLFTHSFEETTTVLLLGSLIGLQNHGHYDSIKPTL